jgi:hypothetical protein
MPDPTSVTILLPEAADVESNIANILLELHEHIVDTQFIVNQDESLAEQSSQGAHIPVELLISLKVIE